MSLRHKLGHRIFVRLRAGPIRNGHGSIIGDAESLEEDIAAWDWNRRQDKLADCGPMQRAEITETGSFPSIARTPRAD